MDCMRNSGSAAILSTTLMKGMRRLGADYQRYGTRSDSIHSIRVSFNDEAHRYLVKALQENTQDADVLDPNDPLLQFMLPGEGMVPSLQDQMTIIEEANAIIVAYQNLRATDFVEGAPVPTVGPPIGLDAPGIFFCHSTISVHAVPERISNPGPVCPTINSQASGTFLGSLQMNFANAVLVIHVPRS